MKPVHIVLIVLGVAAIGAIAFLIARRPPPAPQLQPTIAPAPQVPRERRSGPNAGEIIGAVATVVGQFAAAQSGGGAKS